MSIPYTIVSNGDESNVTVFLPEGIETAHSSHRNYDKIVAACEAQESEGLAEMFDPSAAIEANFTAIGERVSVRGGNVYLDGDRIENALTDQIVRFYDAGVGDYKPLVAFMEKVQANPQPDSRDRLFAWLDTHDFTIMDDGDLVAYKGVTSDGNGGYESINHGTAIVNGVVHAGAIPYAVGDVVEMPRSEVNHDPANGCSTGLHVGTYDYAKGWSGSGVMLRVTVNPRDSVSVPNYDEKKMRVCRFKIEEIIDAPCYSPIFYGGTMYNPWEDAEDDGRDE